MSIEQKNLHLQLTRNILSEIGNQEVNRLFSYEKCELEYDFIAFLDSYADLKEIVPKDYTIIDLGCYQALQGHLFRDYAGYIGVDMSIPIEYRLRQNNAEYYDCTIQEFIEHILPELNLDLKKAFAVCSYVPDMQAREMVRNTFPYFRDKYCDDIHEYLLKN